MGKVFEYDIHLESVEKSLPIINLKSGFKHIHRKIRLLKQHMPGRFGAVITEFF